MNSGWNFCIKKLVCISSSVPLPTHALMHFPNFSELLPKNGWNMFTRCSTHYRPLKHPLWITVEFVNNAPITYIIFFSWSDKIHSHIRHHMLKIPTFKDSFFRTEMSKSKVVKLLPLFKGCIILTKKGIKWERWTLCIFLVSIIPYGLL